MSEKDFQTTKTVNEIMQGLMIKLDSNFEGYSVVSDSFQIPQTVVRIYLTQIDLKTYLLILDEFSKKFKDVKENNFIIANSDFHWRMELILHLDKEMR